MTSNILYIRSRPPRHNSLVVHDVYAYDIVIVFGANVYVVIGSSF
jgi:hypothetical protein